MSKDPAFLFYTSDFFMGTLLLNFEEKGKYITLLATMHQVGRMNEHDIEKIIGHVPDNLKAKFKIDEQGLWYNERLEEEIAKRSNFIKTCKKNGAMGGRPKEREFTTENEDTLFQRFWRLYDKPIGKRTCLRVWKKLKKKEIEALLLHVPAYVQATPDKQFRKNPQSYLHQKTWLDEMLPIPAKPITKSAIEELLQNN